MINSRRDAKGLPPAKGLRLGLLRTKAKLKCRDIEKRAIQKYENLQKTLATKNNELPATSAIVGAKKELETIGIKTRNGQPEPFVDLLRLPLSQL